MQVIAYKLPAVHVGARTILGTTSHWSSKPTVAHYWHDMTSIVALGVRGTVKHPYAMEVSRTVNFEQKDQQECWLWDIY